MASRRRSIAALAAVALLAGGAAPRGPVDADSRAWWGFTAALSNDAMQGRDTGSAGHERAARMVAARLAAAGVKPLGENGTFFQRVPLHETAVTAAKFTADGRALAFLDQFTVTPDSALPARLTARIAYRGYCARGALGDVRGKLVVCHATRRAGLTTAAERETAVLEAGAAGLISIADPGFVREPPRWPYAYARAVDIAGTTPTPDPFPRLTLKAEALGLLLPGRDAAALVRKGAAGEPLPSIDGAQARLGFTTASRDLTSPNVVGILPGTDPKLADQAIVLGAHLDGYGRGRSVKGDAIYNGTLDDAAYVALIVRLAERRGGKGFARPVIFAAWTGEEKGLLGSRWFVAHPTRPLAAIAGVINLDQLRPIFPLKLLTVHARTDSTLGDDATAIASARGIAVQDDPEPERNLLRRTDHWPFLQARVPGINFVFGYQPGSPSEAVYRHWYQTGYHKPQDDLKQPMDWQAAADFNRFFYDLVARVADQPKAPEWKRTSKLRPAS